MRGKIFRDTNQGEGVVYVEGLQKPFSLERHWNGSSPPQVGMPVEVELDSKGDVLRLTQIDEATLVKEQAHKALGTLGAYGQRGARQLLARVGAPALIVLGLLAIAWLFLPALHVQLARTVVQSATFYDLLRLANAPAGVSMAPFGAMDQQGAGLWALLMWLCLLAPLASHFHPQRYLPLLYGLPLAFMALVHLTVYFGFKNQISKAAALGGSLGGSMGEKLASQMINSAMNAFSAGWGLYLSYLLALLLAGLGLRAFMAKRAPL